MTITVTEEVREVLAGCAFDVEGVLRIKQKLERPLYVKVNKVLDALGGKWNKSKKGHLFNGDGRTAVEDVAATGQYIDWKRTNEFFETPHELADDMLDRAGVRFKSKMLEPSAGKGAIAEPAALRGAYVRAYERHEPYARVLSDSIEALVEDFLYVQQEPVYDAVVMNPPFRSDMIHVLHAALFVKEGGSLVSIMGPGWTFRTTRQAQEFRTWVALVNADWEELPPGTFASSGTRVSSGMLTMRRPEPEPSKPKPKPKPKGWL